MSDGADRAGRPRCHHCEDVIGVFEPVVLETQSGPYETSLIVDPWLAESRDPCYHRACYAVSHSECE